MSRNNRVDARVLVTATSLVALGTLVRVVLAPGPAELGWKPASSDRPSETLTEARGRVDSALMAEAAAALPLLPGETIDLNTADVISLRRLPGVGRSRAAAIVEDRAAHGPFRSTRDLVRVPGVGEGLVRSIKDYAKTTYVAGSPVDNRAEGRLDLNRAQIKELEQITGIGPALAARIVAARTARGRFRGLDELLEIPGIGPKTLQILQQAAYVR